MNSRNVIRNLLNGDKPFRVGFNDFFWPETLQSWADEGNFPTLLDESTGEKRLGDHTSHFGFDMGCPAPADQWFDFWPIRGHSKILEETDEWEIRENGAGASFKYWKHKSGAPEHIRFRMASREIWERDYRHHLVELDPQRVNFQLIAKRFKHKKELGVWTYYNTYFVWEIMRSSLGDLCMYENLLLDEEWILDFNGVYTDFFKNHYRMIFDKVGKPDGICLAEDLGYKNSLFCAPKILDRLVFPFYREIVRFFHSEGLPVFLHSCGYVEPALPYIRDIGFDFLHPMEVKAGCDPLAFADQYHDSLVFVGGLDVRILESGDRALIKKEVIQLVEGMKARGARYVFGSDHSIPPSVKYDDFMYAICVYRDHMMY